MLAKLNSNNHSSIKRHKNSTVTSMAKEQHGGNYLVKNLLKVILFFFPSFAVSFFFLSIKSFFCFHRFTQ